MPPELLKYGRSWTMCFRKGLRVSDQYGIRSGPPAQYEISMCGTQKNEASLGSVVNIPSRSSPSSTCETAPRVDGASTPAATTARRCKPLPNGP